MEHVVSDERLRRIIGRAYRAGEAGEERYTQLLADGPEVVRCRDCGCVNETLAYPEDYEHVEPMWVCCKFGHTCRPDGFCAWPDRDGAKEAV